MVMELKGFFVVFAFRSLDYNEIEEIGDRSFAESKIRQMWVDESSYSWSQALQACLSDTTV